MRLLAIDTTQTCAAALVRLEGGSGDICDMVVSRPPPGAPSGASSGAVEALMPMLADVMARGGAAFRGANRPDRIAVTTGPGRFTGVRVGLAAARALALTSGIELAGVSALEIVAAGACPRAGEKIFAVLSAPRGMVYCQAFDGDGTGMSAPVCLSPSEAVARLPAGRVIMAGSGSDTIAAALPADAGARVSPMAQSPPDAMEETLGLLARLAARREAAVAPEPLYLSRPGAGQPVAPSAAMA